MNEVAKGIVMTPFNLLYKLSPKTELKVLFKLKTGRRLNLVEPKSFNEKMNWLKLYDSDLANQLKPRLCDKYMVREYVQEKMGNSESDILNELYWEGFNPEEIPFNRLPKQFVIKVTHGSTFNIIVRDQDEIDRNKIVQKLKLWLSAKFIPCYGEWWYGIVKPRVIVEKYLENKDKGELLDYKVFCFNGEPKLIDVHSGRFGNHKRNVYDTNWNFLKDVNFKYPHSEAIDKPLVLSELLQCAKILSRDFMQVRVDFFIVDNKLYFSEFTFANGAGFDPITPYSFDLKMGSWISLDKAGYSL